MHKSVGVRLLFVKCKSTLIHKGYELFTSMVADVWQEWLAWVKGGLKYARLPINVMQGVNVHNFVAVEYMRV